MVWITGYLSTGLILGLLYFGGLWLTIEDIVHRSHPYILLICSMIIRMMVVLGALYLIVQTSWAGLAVSLVGFVIMRMILVILFKPPGIQPAMRK